MQRNAISAVSLAREIMKTQRGDVLNKLEIRDDIEK